MRVPDEWFLWLRFSLVMVPPPSLCELWRAGCTIPSSRLAKEVIHLGPAPAGSRLFHYLVLLRLEVSEFLLNFRSE